VADIEFTIDQSQTTITLSSGTYLIETELSPTIEIIQIATQGPEGIQGEPGRDGLGSVTYVHTQSVASTSWNINHDLGKFPSVTVVDSSNRLVFAMVEYLDENNLVVSVAAPFAGLAYLN